jgi:hypothetical protein
MWKTQVEMISKGICPFFLGLDFVKVRNFINKQFGIRSHSLQSIRESKSTWTVKGQNNLKQNTLFTCYWRFLQIKCVLTLKQLKYQWKKIRCGNPQVRKLTLFFQIKILRISALLRWTQIGSTFFVIDIFWRLQFLNHFIF